MSNLVVITFENEEEAGKVREAVRKLQNQSLLKLDDSGRRGQGRRRQSHG